MQEFFPMQPYAPPGPQSMPTQAAAGLGEYQPAFEAAAGTGIGAIRPMPTAAASIQPFEASAGMGFPDPAGLGSYVNYPIRTPRSQSWQLLAQASPLMGALGQVSDAITEKKEVEAAGGSAALKTGAIIALIGTGLILRGGAGYIVGSALAPSDEDETAYAWGGVLASVFFGSVGLGVEALIARSKG